MTYRLRSRYVITHEMMGSRNGIERSVSPSAIMACRLLS
jgi:hypothetical protein